jgi:hypothetical protein
MAEIKKFLTRVIPDEENAPKRIYVNGAVIHHSTFDFTINFFEFIPPLQPEEPEGGGPIDIVVPINARIGMNADLVPKLIKALETNYQKYLDEQESVAE